MLKRMVNFKYFSEMPFLKRSAIYNTYKLGSEIDSYRI